MTDDEVMKKIQDVIKQAADRALQEALALRPVSTFDDETVVDDSLVVDGSVSYPVDDPSHLLEQRVKA